MPLSFRDIDFAVELPDIPATSPVVGHTPPCATERDDTIRALAEVLRIDLKGTAQEGLDHVKDEASSQAEDVKDSAQDSAGSVKESTAAVAALGEALAGHLAAR